MIKKVLIIVGALLLTGCASKDLNDGYNNMQVGKDKINGYNLDLKISGVLNGTQVESIIRIKNYNNTDYEIIVNNAYSGPMAVKGGTPGAQPDSSSSKVDELPVSLGESTIYIKSGKVYTQNANGSYVINDTKVKYSNPTIYLEGLKHIKKNSTSTNEKIGNRTYKKYDITVGKDIVKSMLEDIGSADTIDKDIKATVYLDSSNIVYKIIYYVDKTIIAAGYYGVNNSKAINFPAEIK